MISRFSFFSLLFALPLFISLPSLANALTVEEAYQAIPHKRIAYDATLSTRTQEEKEYLSQLFTLSDKALVERVETMQALAKGNEARFQIYEEHVSSIERDLRALKEPPSAQGLTVILLNAIENQHHFFLEWAQALRTKSSFSFPGGATGQGVHQNIRAASGALHQLYGELQQRYGSEHAQNRDSFYQHLCALDFI